MKCEDVEIRLKSFLSDDIDDQNKIEIKDHLNICSQCSQSLKQLTKLSKVVQTWKGIKPSPQLLENIKSHMDVGESRSKRIFTTSFLKKAGFRLAEATAVVLLAFLFSLFMRKPIPTTRNYSDTINVYLTEHQGAVLQTVSQDLSSQPLARLRISREDILYYEQIDSSSRFMRPGVILREPSDSEDKSRFPETRSISEGETLDLARARKTVDFDLVAPSRFHPGFILDRIRKIKNYNSIHLLYTNGIDTISLFEQPVNGKRGLEAQDFREYAIYRSVEPISGEIMAQEKVTILAWSNGIISFVLIGKADMSQMMDIAQSISMGSED